jgi:hypothetical protein
MSRRRLIELLVAAAVFLLLLAIVFVRPTSRRTGAPASMPLFARAPGAPPDFGNHAYSASVAFASDSSRALVLYPVVIETTLPLRAQASALRIGYVLLLALVVACAIVLWRGHGAAAAAKEEKPPEPLTGIRRQAA